MMIIVVAILTYWPGIGCDNGDFAVDVDGAMAVRCE